ncbi:unnamed protein product [Somion occarium]|uniref:Hydrophobin n=1 Tax=Somion occarium TaxID=3059160 RepID=A0ABP1D4M1_9APHY
MHFCLLLHLVAPLLNPKRTDHILWYKAFVWFACFLSRTITTFTVQLPSSLFSFSTQLPLSFSTSLSTFKMFIRASLLFLATSAALVAALPCNDPSHNHPSSVNNPPTLPTGSPPNWPTESNSWPPVSVPAGSPPSLPSGSSYPGWSGIPSLPTVIPSTPGGSSGHPSNLPNNPSGTIPNIPTNPPSKPTSPLHPGTTSALPTEITSAPSTQPSEPASGGSGSGSGGYGSGGGHCNTGPVQCCNSVQSAGSPEASKQLGLLGIVLGDANIPVGLTCSPITAVGAGGGGNCAATPVCCENNSYSGVVNIGCVPIVIQG